MFSKGSEYSGEKVPGFITVPIDKFKVARLAEYLKEGEHLTMAQEFAAKYVAGKLKYDRAHDKIS